jgi:putative transcriptional regulator
MPDSLQGHLLIASPMLSDPNFFRSVVYLARHNEEGALGFVINRPGRACLADLIEEVRGRRPARQDAIYCGGPIDGPLIALHTLENLGDLCADRIWLTSDDDHIFLLADRTDVPARFFDGYGGWGPGQLEAEIAAGGWLVAPASDQTVWGEPDSIWEACLKQRGHSVLRSVLPGAGEVDPNLN